ncbi:MAG: hypothetical protein D6714_04490, partial [Bacteroidetes bacterium]
MKTSILAGLLLLSTPFFAQTQLSGIINTYAAVVETDTCEGRLMLADSAAFMPGESVLIFQMKGASINTSNNASYGEISDLGGAGWYEKATLAGVSGKVLWVENKLLHAYDPAQGVQVVSFPEFADAEVADTLRPKAWDGKTGGILAFRVTGQLTLHAPIIGDGGGFRGGDRHVVQSNCSFLTFADNYAYPFDNWRGAPKGEGVAQIIPGMEAG